MGTLLIHFTAEDMARTRLVTRPDPLWELISSLHRLQTRRGYPAYEGWHLRVRRDIARSGLAGVIRSRLLSVVPLGGYFPDFLTPGPVVDLDQGIDLVLGAEPARMRQELGRLASPPGTAAWLDDLAAGRSDALCELGDAMRRYFRIAIAPYWTDVSGSVSSERALRGATVLDHGVGRILDDLGSRAQWEPPVLAIDGYPRDGNLHLGGRGLTLIPSYFCWRDPITLANPDLPPTLVYPAHRQRSGHPSPRSRKLGPLIGTTRLEVLLATTHGVTTGELARRVGISPATASHHATVLREAGLVDSQRQGNQVVHRLSPTGAELLDDRP